MLVAPDSPLVGKTIEDAGLRHLPGVYLAEIDRDGLVLPAVSPQERCARTIGWCSWASSNRSSICRRPRSGAGHGPGVQARVAA